MTSVAELRAWVWASRGRAAAVFAVLGGTAGAIAVPVVAGESAVVGAIWTAPAAALGGWWLTPPSGRVQGWAGVVATMGGALLCIGVYGWATAPRPTWSTTGLCESVPAVFGVDEDAPGVGTGPSRDAADDVCRREGRQRLAGAAVVIALAMVAMVRSERSLPRKQAR